MFEFIRTIQVETKENWRITISIDQLEYIIKYHKIKLN